MKFILFINSIFIKKIIGLLFLFIWWQSILRLFREISVCVKHMTVDGLMQSGYVLRRITLVIILVMSGTQTLKMAANTELGIR